MNEVATPESSISEKSDITLIRAQLEQMSSILKGANYRPGGKPNNKQKANGKATQQVSQDARQGLKGQELQQQVLLLRVDILSSVIGAVGGAITNKTVLTKSP